MAAAASAGGDDGGLGVKYARELNCLVDADRSKRKAALKKLDKELFVGEEGVPGLLAFFSGPLSTTLLRVMADSVERLREAGIALYARCAALSSVAPALPALLPALLPVLASRIGTSPFNEGSEELRLQLLQLTLQFLVAPACRDALGEALDSVAGTLAKVAGDAFPAVKVDAAVAVQALCGAVPAHIAGVASPLTKALLANTGHQRGNVRAAAIRALGRLLPLAGGAAPKLLGEAVLPALAPRLLDRTGAVRKALAGVLAGWLHQLPPPAATAHTPALLRALLTATADAAEDVAAAALLALHSAAETAAAAAPPPPPVPTTDLEVAAAAAAGAPEEATSPPPVHAAGGGGEVEVEGYEDIVLPAPFTSRPPPAARALVRAHLAPLLGAALEELQDWKADTRGCAAGALRSAVVYAEGAVEAHLDSLLPALCRATTDDEAGVVAVVNDCAALVGAFVPPAAQLGALLPQVRGEGAGMAGLEHRAAALAVLANAVSGMDPDAFTQHLPAVAAALGDPALAEAAPPTLPPALAGALGAVSDVAGEAAASPPALLPLLRGALHLQRLGQAPDAVAAGTAVAEALAAVGGVSLVTLLATAAPELLDAAAGSVETWTRAHVARCEVDAAVRMAPAAFAPCLPRLLELLALTLSPSRDADLRLAQLALLDALATAYGSEASGPARAAFEAVATLVVRDLLAPNLVWAVGAVASTVRKVAMATLHTLLKGGLLLSDGACVVWPSLAPRLVSVLGDDDETTRHIAVLVLAALLPLLPAQLDDEGVRAVYPELLKRLDDSSDTVRVCACSALAALPRAVAPGGMRGGPTEFTLDALLVHMDDSDSGMQAAAAAAAAVYVALDQEYAAKAIASARTRHRSPALLDALLAGDGAAAGAAQ